MNCILLTQVVKLVSLVPVVAMRVREHLAPGVDRTARDRQVAGQIRRLQLCPGVLVPEAELTVTSARSQCLVDRVKSNVVDSVNILGLVGRGRLASVALECEIVLGVGCLHVLDGHTALDAAQGEAGRVLVLVEEDADAPVLELERGLDGLEFGRLVVEAVDFDEIVAAGDDGHRAVGVGAVALVG